MSRIDDLIKELCPNGVEWKALSSLVKTVTAPAKLKRQAYCLTGKYPIIDQGTEFIAGYTDENIKTVQPGKYIIFGDHSEHIKYVDFPFIQGADGLKILRPISENAKYIYFAFQNFYKKKGNYKRHWARAQDTLIPIPPLPVQKEIVRVLDSFTELEARQKQYEYYRDQLLTFDEDDGVRICSLEDVIENLRTGLNPRQNFKLNTPDAQHKYITVRELGGFSIVPTEKTDLVNDEGLSRIQARSKLKKGDVLFRVLAQLVVLRLSMKTRQPGI